MPSLNNAPDDTQRLRSDALGWFARRRDAGWRKEDEPAFQAWLAADPRHAEAYASCSEQWHELDGMPADLLARMRRNLDRDKAQLGARQAVVVPSRRRFLAWPAAYAMVAAAAGGVGYVVWQRLQSSPTYMQAFQTARGEQRTVTLPDGSRLRMDTATRLEVSFYRERREVHLLDGQAVFEVQPDTMHPFHVLAGAVRTTVVGTRFSVRYTPGLPGNAGVQVAVEEGKVRVVRLDASAQLQGEGDAQAGTLLVAGQRVAADTRGALGQVSAVPGDGIAPWRDQRISFVDVPLAQALAELERYQATGLVVRDPKVAALRLSGTFDPMAAGVLRKALPRVLPVRLRDQEGQTEIVPAN